jgi:hypothetical protein
LSTTNPTWLDPGLNPGRRCGKLETNRLSYGAASNVAISNNNSTHLNLKLFRTR